MTRKLLTNFNARPYFDDFEVDKNFLRVLFKPGTALQAREITQLQTIIKYNLTMDQKENKKIRIFNIQRII